MWHKYQTHTQTRYDMETHMRKTTKVLFIWHEKYVSIFCLQTHLADSSLGILYNSSRLLSPHARRFWVYIVPLAKTTLFFSSLTKQSITNVNPTHSLGSPFYKILPILINQLFYVIQKTIIYILVHLGTTDNRNYHPKIQWCFITKSVIYSN